MGFLPKLIFLFLSRVLLSQPNVSSPLTYQSTLLSDNECPDIPDHILNSYGNTATLSILNQSDLDEVFGTKSLSDHLGPDYLTKNQPSLSHSDSTTSPIDSSSVPPKDFYICPISRFNFHSLSPSCEYGYIYVSDEDTLMIKTAKIYYNEHEKNSILKFHLKDDKYLMAQAMRWKEFKYVYNRSLKFSRKVHISSNMLHTLAPRIGESYSLDGAEKVVFSVTYSKINRRFVLKHHNSATFTFCEADATRSFLYLHQTVRKTCGPYILEVIYTKAS